VGGRNPNWLSRAATGRVSPAVVTLLRGPFPRVLATSRTCLPSAVNRKAKEFRSTIRLAPQT
jgi:hypothetical protein